jgi:hypothetical protein
MPNPNTGVIQRRTSMPSDWVSSARSVDARTIMPTRVRVSTSHTSTDSATSLTARKPLKSFDNPLVRRTGSVPVLPVEDDVALITTVTLGISDPRRHRAATHKS